jgi:hypothetical protein
MDQIVRRRRTISRPLDQRTPQRPSGQRWSSEEDTLRCAASEEIVVFGCQHGRSPQPSPLTPRKVVATPQIAPREVAVAATTPASGRRGHRRSCLGQSWPRQRSRLGPPLVCIAWGRRSHLTRLQPPPGPETLIPRGLECFYRRPDLIRLNRMACLT